MADAGPRLVNLEGMTTNPGAGLRNKGLARAKTDYINNIVLIIVTGIDDREKQY